MKNNTSNGSYGLPAVTAAYVVTNPDTGETYHGSTNCLSIRWKTHRKINSKANQLLESPNGLICWIECSTVEMARKIERAGYYAFRDAGAVNETAPSESYKTDINTGRDAVLRQNELDRESRAKNKERVNQLARERYSKYTPEQLEAKRARDKRYRERKKQNA